MSDDWIKNLTDTELDAFSIVAIGNSLFDPEDAPLEFKEKLLFEGNMPSLDTHWAEMGILQKSCGKNQCAPIMRSGETRCKVDLLNADDEFANMTPDDPTKLTSSPCCGLARIIYKETLEAPGTGEVWAIVEFPPSGVEWVHVFNDTGVDIPAYAAMKANRTAMVGDNARYSVSQPDAASLANIIILDGNVLKDGEDRWICYNEVRSVLYDPGGANPVTGDTLGTVSGEWYLSISNSGWECYGADTTEGLCFVRPFSGIGWRTEVISGIAAIDSVSGTDQTIEYVSELTFDEPFTVPVSPSTLNIFIAPIEELRLIADSADGEWGGESFILELWDGLLWRRSEPWEINTSPLITQVGESIMWRPEPGVKGLALFPIILPTEETFTKVRIGLDANFILGENWTFRITYGLIGGNWWLYWVPFTPAFL